MGSLLYFDLLRLFLLVCEQSGGGESCLGLYIAASVRGLSNCGLEGES